MRRKLAFILAIFLIAGCGRKEAPETEGSGAHISPKHGGVLRIALTGELRSLDPARVGDTASGLVASQIYEGLLELGDDLKLYPCLAQSWEVSQDGLVYTFHLRKGVHFQDDPCFPGGQGREVRAEDVKYSLERIADPSTLSTGWWLFNDRIVGINEYREELAKAEKEGREPRIKGVEGIEVVDDYTLRIHLKKPFAPFKYVFAMSYTWVVPREAVDYYGKDFFKHPVGTGPFKLAEWSPGQQVRLVRNPNYWGKDEDGYPLPYLDGINIRLLRDVLIAFLEFDKGNLDVSGIPPQVWDKVMNKDKTLKGKYRKYKLRVTPTLSIDYYGFMMTKEPFGSNKYLRQALNYAIDRQAIIDNVFNGRGIPAKGVLPPGMPGYNKDLKGYYYDPQKARELLAKAGYPNGEGLPEITLQLNSGGTMNEDNAEAIQAQLAKIGVKIKLRLISWPQHLDSIDQGVPEFFRLGWIADYPDPENFMALFYSKNWAPAGPNATRFKNEEFDRLYEQAISEMDEQKRMALYRKMEEIVVEEAPWLFLSHGEAYGLAQPYVEDLPLNPMGHTLYKRVWLNKEKMTK